MSSQLVRSWLNWANGRGRGLSRLHLFHCVKGLWRGQKYYRSVSTLTSLGVQNNWEHPSSNFWKNRVLHVTMGTWETAITFVLSRSVTLSLKSYVVHCWVGRENGICHIMLESWDRDQKQEKMGDELEERKDWMNIHVKGGYLWALCLFMKPMNLPHFLIKEGRHWWMLSNSPKSWSRIVLLLFLQRTYISRHSSGEDTFSKWRSADKEMKKIATLWV